jgi:hypothetical protein
MLELIERHIGAIIILSTFGLLWLVGSGIKLAIEEPQHQSENRLVRTFFIIFEGIGNAFQFGGIIALILLYVALFVVLPAYVLIHFIVKYW